MRVLVLGCGPAGLMAAHAASIEEHDVLVVSGQVKKSYLNGCQYLHQSIPYFSTGAPIDVKYTLNGSPQEYREKVYGNRQTSVSPDQYADVDHMAWDIRATYDGLWDTYGSYVMPRMVGGPQDLSALLNEFTPDHVISTIPRPSLCDGSHNFDAEQVWALGDAPGVGQVAPFRIAENTVICDGTKEVGWYRAANVFGHMTVEWPWRNGNKPPVSNVVPVVKPLSTDCDCHLKHFTPVTLLGRYGLWRKGVLAHEAFYDAFPALRTVAAGTYRIDTLPGL